MMLAVAAVGGALGLAAPAAHAFGVAQNCTRPTTGTTLTPNEPCWVAGVYNDDYTGMTDLNYIGAPAQVSGGHPFTGVTDFTVASTTPPVSNVRVDIPPGLVSNPLATPKCSDSQLTSNSCPNNTQLGIVKLEAALGPVNVFVGASVYNMPTESSHCSGYVSDYSFNAPAAGRVDICGSVLRQPPYNLYFTIVTPPGAATVSSTLIFWGMPGDSGHNPQRGWVCGPTIAPCTPPSPGSSSPSGTPFLTNPTSCLPAGAVSTLALTGGGQTATATSPTPVPAINCTSLPFSPKLKLQLKGGNQTAVGKHPTLIANLTQSPGQANIAGSTVTLPLTLALDPNNSSHVCAPLAAFNDTCPSKTLIGSARATTPLLNQPLTGKVYLVQGIGCTSHQPPTLQGTCTSGQPLRILPALLVTLRGGGAALDLHAQTSTPHSKFLSTTFFSLPDLPVSTFQLKINGGKRGILVVTGHRSLCKSGRQVASSVFTGQSGKKAPSKIKIKTPCKK
jgi:hypothetical protein